MTFDKLINTLNSIKANFIVMYDRSEPTVYITKKSDPSWYIRITNLNNNRCYVRETGIVYNANIYYILGRISAEFI